MMNSIKILLWNTRGFNSKKEEITQKFREADIDVGIITKMKNKTKMNNTQRYVTSISGYNSIIENSYNYGLGGAGGVAIIVKKNIRVREINLENTHKKKSLTVVPLLYMEWRKLSP